MDLVSSPVDVENRETGVSEPQSQGSNSSGLVPSHGIFIDVEPPANSGSHRPQILSHFQDDGSAQHRINQYIVKQEIGRGSFGAVHLAVDENGEEYAVKEFSKSRLRKRAQSHILRSPRALRQRGNLAPDDFNSPLHRNPATDPNTTSQATNSINLIREEIAIMKKLNHPNLVSLIEVLDDPKEDSLYMVLEMCKKGVVMRVGLGETADPYSEEQCRCWFRDLMLGIEYLHAQGILHRDIKPDNCLLTKDDVLKVVDFGVSEMFEKDSEMLTVKSAGSPAFLPPELCVVRHGGISGKAADIWSMGVTLYCLRFGRIPFERGAILDLYEAIKNDSPNLPAGHDDPFCDVMLKLLEKDPERRIKMKELRVGLNSRIHRLIHANLVKEHPWITKNGTDALLSYEENTSDLVEPPTEEEVNRAITSNLKNLITVMKAVRKFKGLIAHNRPPIMASILGEEGTRYMSLSPTSLMESTSGRVRSGHKSMSVDAHDRRPLETSLVAEGVHRKIETTMPTRGGRLPNDRNLGVSDIGRAESPVPPLYSHSPLLGGPLAEDDRGRTTPTADREAFPPFARTDMLLEPETMMKAQTTDNIGRRGHAHDPLEDQLYLFIGPSTFAGVSEHEERRGSFMPDNDDVPVVSESPGAADIDIYETAYRDEIERIRARLQEEGKDMEDMEPMVYLTRRVDAKLLALGGFAGRMMAYGEEGIDRVKEIRHLKEGRARVSGISRALRAAAREEYERRKAERRARETVETAKAEAHKTKHSPEPHEDGRGQDGPPPKEAKESVQQRDEEMTPIGRSSSSLLSSVSGKAWEKGKLAKSSFRGFYDKARELGSRQGSGSF
ncbi:putative calcium calmodulin-dependent protein kinase kinase [Phaeomoniella chlamydospora]|uniref:Putative calcium calmodulin-dependent protein kinase kinase n=1 Tax=Phaeomoniella chlamydospora TaxID=158046 RepID=A0A0G2E4V2_PHACM|nr:putative calcium calmodulin-dependent protein kinase kinase [Phaeomoniella chlamydospora]